MTKYKFNQRAWGMGLPLKIGSGAIVRSISGKELDLFYVTTDFCSFLARESALYHDVNTVQYDPEVHPITLKVVMKDGEQVWPYQQFDDETIGAVNDDGEFLYFDDPSLLSVEFDLEEVSHE